MSAVVIGIGNRFRGDDGVGPRALDRLPGMLPKDVVLLESDGEPAKLIDAWDGAAVAVVIEAVRHGAGPGSVWRAVVEERSGDVVLPAGSGTHDFGIGAAVAIARALERLPRRLVVVGVEPADLGYGDGLSPAVEATLPRLTEMVADELRSWSAINVP